MKEYNFENREKPMEARQAEQHPKSCHSKHQATDTTHHPRVANRPLSVASPPTWPEPRYMSKLLILIVANKRYHLLLLLLLLKELILNRTLLYCDSLLMQGFRHKHLIHPSVGYKLKHEHLIGSEEVTCPSISI